MTNPLYSRGTGAPAQGSRGRSSVMRNEFDLIEDGFDISFLYCVDASASANTITITPPAALAALTDGLRFRIKVANSTTGATTVSMGSTLGSLPLKREDGSAVTTDVAAGQIINAIYKQSAACLVLAAPTKNYVDTKAAKSGDTYTGTHDFTGAIELKIPTGTNANNPATYAQLIAQAFQAALPSISAGVADYFPTNNGTTGSWSNLLKAGTIRFADSTDTTKRLAFDASGVTTGQTRTATVPDRSGTMALQAKGADIASAATINLDTATGDFVHVTGTTTITAITLSAGLERTVVFDAALTLTHNGTSLILPGAANITTAAGDRATFRGEGSGNVRCIHYTKASGLAVVSTPSALTLISTQSTSGVPYVQWTGLSGYNHYMLILDGVNPNSVQPYLQVGTGAGPTWVTSGYARAYAYAYAASWSVSSGTALADLWGASFTTISTPISGSVVINNMTNGGNTMSQARLSIYNGAGSSNPLIFVADGQSSSTTAKTAIRLITSDGTTNFTGGTASLYGIS